MKQRDRFEAASDIVRDPDDVVVARRVAVVPLPPDGNVVLAHDRPRAAVDNHGLRRPGEPRGGAQQECEYQAGGSRPRVERQLAHLFPKCLWDAKQDRTSPFAASSGPHPVSPGLTKGCPSSTD